MKFHLKPIFVAIAPVAALTAVGVGIRDTVATRTVVSVDHENQTRLRIIQKLNAQRFDTSIYFDDGSGEGRWRYFDRDVGYS